MSGQRIIQGAGNDASLAPTVEQRVVVAPNGLQEALELLAVQAPDFRTLGSVTLDDYERAAAKIRATLKGQETGWGLLLANGFKG